MHKPLPIDDAKQQVNAKNDEKLLYAIQRSRHDGWRPNIKGPQCIHCKHADVQVIAKDYHGISSNELSIFCYSKMRMVLHPYEICERREEKPTLTLQRWC